MISIFDLFSIGIGPSSSHTVGPMRAAYAFLLELGSDILTTQRISITLHGSLAFTGKGHGTDKALIMGLLGEQPDTVDPSQVSTLVNEVGNTQTLCLLGKHTITFHPSTDIIYDYKHALPHHSNGMVFHAFDTANHVTHHSTFYSIGGGFIIKDSDIHYPAPSSKLDEVCPPFPFNSAKELLNHCRNENMRICDVIFANEKSLRPENEIRENILRLANVMEESIERGCQTSGTLPGGLQVRRRAPELYNKLLKQGKPGAKHPDVMNWLNVYAMAVNEENAAGGRVVTAPTNGAAGIIPAVLSYYKYFCDSPHEDGVIEFLLTAAAIGTLYKKNASISGAEMGCQGEVGVACSMAAGALAAALGGTLSQVENAAEIGMEHNLGLTCDPVGGLVQIPCIERNAMGAIKALNAALLALAENGSHKVSLDMVISTMREIGENMNSIYKETSQGGLAIAVNLSEC